MIKITGLWKSQTEKGEAMLSGTISPTSRLVILVNAFKKSDNDPTHIAFIVENKKQEPASPPNYDDGF